MPDKKLELDRKCVSPVWKTPSASDEPGASDLGMGDSAAACEEEEEAAASLDSDEEVGTWDVGKDEENTAVSGKTVAVVPLTTEELEFSPPRNLMGGRSRVEAFIEDEAMAYSK